ncbi:MAG: YfhO family protein [candidate division KSB1 bacterium]|nr:YfhO family protein [candidate division KSB1 bacterium]
MAKKKRKSKIPRPAQPASSSGSQPLVETLAQYPDWTALGIFIFLMAIFFHEIIFGGKIYFSPDLQAPAALATPLKKALWDDGIYPLWTPFIFAGMPSFASLIYTPFVYLPYILFTLLNQIISLPPLLQHVIHYPIAGIGVYLYLREFKVDFLPALLGGVAFMFTPYLITMEVFGHGSQMMTAVYMPMALWAVERLFKSGRMLHLGIAALILGIQFQRGHVQIVYYTWMVLGGYFLYYAIRKIRKGEATAVLPMTGKFALMSLLAFGLSAVLYLSIYEYMPYSIRGSESALATAAATAQKGVGFEYATNWSFSPAEMLTFINPSFFGFGGQTYWGTMPFTDYPNYMGILILLLAIFAVVYRRQAPVLFWAVVAVVALLISFGKHFALLYKLLYNVLPFFNRFRVPVMILIVVQMSVAILAGFGLQRLMAFVRANRDAKQRQWLSGRLFMAATVIIGLALILTVARDLFFKVMQGLYPDQYSPSDQLMLDRRRFDMLLQDGWLVSVWLAGGLTVLALAIRRQLRELVFGLGVLIITLADLWAVDFRLNKPTSKAQLDRYLQADEITRFLQQDTTLYRILPLGSLFGENRWAAQGIQSLGGYHAAKPRVIQDLFDVTQLERNYAMKYYRIVGQGAQRRLQPIEPDKVDVRQRISHQNLIDFLNIKYVISPYPLPEPTLILRNRVNYFLGGQPVNMNIYENTRVLPRAFLVGGYRTFNSPREALIYLTSESFDPRKEVVLYEEPGLTPEPDSLATSKILDYGLHRVEIKVETQKPQLLLLSDTYYPPGWHAFLDGKEVKILQANHAFRAVAVPPGSHTIEFRYNSRAFRTGLWISLVSLLVIAGCIVLGVRGAKQKKDTI